MRDLLIAAIRAYQRWISPHKGFACAYRVHTGRAGCSAFGLRAVQRHGAGVGLALIRRRTRRCGDVHRQCRPSRPVLHAQRGLCDIGCDGPCDGPGRLGLSDAFSCCDCCSCDWPSRRDRSAIQSTRRTPPAQEHSPR